MSLLVNMLAWLSRGFRKSFRQDKLINFIVPQPGEGVAEIEIIKWFVKPNETINEFQPFCEAKSDKANYELTSPYNGKIVNLLYKENEIVKIGDPLFTIEVDDSKYKESSIVSENPEEKKTKIEFQTRISPSARRLMKKHDVDLSKIRNTEKKDIVTKEDIILFMEGNTKKLDINTISNPLHIDPPETPSLAVILRDRTECLTDLQKKMSSTMQKSLSVPIFTFCEDVSMDGIIDLRSQLRSFIKDMHITYLPIFIKALSLAVYDFPIVNSSLFEARLEYLQKGSHNVTIPMDTSQGLLIPNIKRVQEKSIYEIAIELKRIRTLALEGNLQKEDLEDGTISLSNLGSFGGVIGSPLLFHPQVLIGSLGEVRKKLFKENGKIVEKPVLNTSWSADHRLLDGATVAKFVRRWKSLIENPSLMIINLK